MPTKFLWLLLLALASLTEVPVCVAGLAPAINDEPDLRPGSRLTQRTLLTGEVLLINSGVATLKGSPPPPPLVPFGASFRVYLAHGNIFVTTVIANSQGKFAIALAPGRYRLVPEIMHEGRALAAGAANRVIVGPYESAPPLDINLQKDTPLQVTITYRRSMGN